MSSSTEEIKEPIPSTGVDKEVSLLDLLLVLARNKRILLGVPFLVAVIAGSGSLLMDNVYTGTARILPPQQQSSASTAALLAQMGGPAAILGAAAIGRPSDLYAGMLKGDTIADRLIARFKLQELYDKDTLVETRQELAKRTDIAAGREGIVSVSVEDSDPKRAAAIANAYGEELQQLAQGLALTEAAQRRVFFEQELAKARQLLSQAEVELKKTQESTGLIQLDQQGRAIIEAIAGIRAEIAAKEVQIVSSRTFATDTNPEVIRLRQQLSGLRTELAKLEMNNVGGAGDVFIPTGKVPEAGLEYIRKVRDLKYQETVMELLARQYEIARLDEAKDIALIQFIDRAVPPDRKSKPYRVVIMIAAAFIAGVFALLWVVLKEAASHARENPDTEKKLRALHSLVTRL